MASNGEVVERWLAVIEGRASRLIGGRSNSVMASGNTVYSYGRHFPMAVAMDSPTLGRWYLLNGDRYSVTTSGHQSMVRGALTGRTTMIVPFTALNAAGIVRESIEPVEITEDTWETRIRQSHDLKDVPRHLRTYVEPFPCPGEDTCEDARAIRTRYGYTYSHHGSTVRDKQRDADGLYRWEVSEHRLGASVFRATWRVERPSRRTCRGPFDIQGWDDTRVCRHGSRTEHRPNVTDEGTDTFLSGFDEQERPPLYFLAQLPREAVA